MALPPTVGPLLVAAERRVAAVGTLRSLEMHTVAKALDDVGEPGDEPTEEPDGDPPVEVDPPPARGLAPMAARSVGVEALDPLRAIEPLRQHRSPQRTTTGAGATNVRVPPPSAVTVPALLVALLEALLEARLEAVALAAALADAGAS